MKTEYEYEILNKYLKTLEQGRGIEDSLKAVLITKDALLACKGGMIADIYEVTYKRNKVASRIRFASILGKENKEVVVRYF